MSLSRSVRAVDINIQGLLFLVLAKLSDGRTADVLVAVAVLFFVLSCVAALKRE